jgi:hypothetical protein
VEKIAINLQFNSKREENIIALNYSSVLNGKIITGIYFIHKQKRVCYLSIFLGIRFPRNEGERFQRVEEISSTRAKGINKFTEENKKKIRLKTRKRFSANTLLYVAKIDSSHVRISRRPEFRIADLRYKYQNRLCKLARTHRT